MIRDIYLTTAARDGGVPQTLVEIWQANASGAYVDNANPEFMPLDPNFTGAGRSLTDNDGRFGNYVLPCTARLPENLGAYVEE